MTSDECAYTCAAGIDKNLSKKTRYFFFFCGKIHPCLSSAPFLLLFVFFFF